MSDPTFKPGHKRHRSSHLEEYFHLQKKTRTAAHKHHRSHSSNKSISAYNHISRNTALPANRSYIQGKRLTSNKSSYQNQHHRNYYKIPNNVKYAPGARMSVSTPAGHINNDKKRERDNDESKHVYETRIVKPKHYHLAATRTRQQQQWSAFERTKMKIEMQTENTWPTWTFNAAALYFQAHQSHYENNIGLRHKTVIDLKKFSTQFIYKSTSNQPWSRRIIVWTSTKDTRYNRTTNADGTNSVNELELTGFLGTMTEHQNKALFKWQEQSVSQDGTTSEVDRQFDNLLTKPRDVKHPGPPFYWQPSKDNPIIYDETKDIPGKTNYLDSEMFLDDTWQKGPQEIEYDDTRQRGGGVTGSTGKLLFGKNTFITVIWQPLGRFSGEPLAATPTEDNSLLCDVIFTTHWEEH
jgi:hypothetical protein